MSDSTTLTLEVSKDLDERLEAVARNRQSNKSDVVAEAIAAFLHDDEVLTHLIEKRTAQADAGGPFVPHEEMERWLDSWGSENELLPPAATIRIK